MRDYVCIKEGWIFLFLYYKTLLAEKHDFIVRNRGNQRKVSLHEFITVNSLPLYCIVTHNNLSGINTFNIIEAIALATKDVEHVTELTAAMPGAHRFQWCKSMPCFVYSIKIAAWNGVTWRRLECQVSCVAAAYHKDPSIVKLCQAWHLKCK